MLEHNLRGKIFIKDALSGLAQRTLRPGRKFRVRTLRTRPEIMAITSAHFLDTASCRVWTAVDKGGVSTGDRAHVVDIRFAGIWPVDSWMADRLRRPLRWHVAAAMLRAFCGACSPAARPRSTLFIAFFHRV